MYFLSRLAKRNQEGYQELSVHCRVYVSVQVKRNENAKAFKEQLPELSCQGSKEA